jgi:lipopolysaccharide/colanic/teichoic acid biosynthesis glycosyltransferase
MQRLWDNTAGAFANPSLQDSTDWNDDPSARKPPGRTQSERKSKLRTAASVKANLLPQSYFLKQLQCEKRRSDRSKAPLSIALFCFADNKESGAIDIQVLLDLLENSIRDTDILGYVVEDIIGLLLPDTDEKGTQEFVKKIVKGDKFLPFSIITATYPDLIFKNLVKKSQNDPTDFYHVFLDHFIKPTRFGYPLKASLDFLGALIGILICSPLMLITAIAIQMTSPGPIIFKQIRLGKRGVPFVFYKFRSMSWKADDRIHREYVTNLIKGNLEGTNQGDKEKPLYKIKVDPRVTRVGRIIRKASIDELPQLFNVLKGDMSLVGPRPPLPYEAEKYQPWHLRRVSELKPGITGLWQVDGRSKTTFDDMVRMDLRYIRRCSFKLDLQILIKTIKVVLRCDGAN